MATIEAPARATRAATASTLVIFALFALTNAVPWHVAAWLTLLLVIATAVAAVTRDAFGIHAGLLGSLCYGVRWVPVIGEMFPLNTLAGLAAYALVVALLPRLRASSAWLRRGTVDRTTVIAIVGFAATSAVALVVWRYTTTEDVARFSTFVPPVLLGVPRAAIPLLILGYAMLNAAFEEVVWRGVIMQSLESALGRGPLVCVLQAVGFGVWHYRGFPSGLVGSGLAAIFALMMGILRMRGRGMLAPYLAHVCADATIFTMVAAMILGAK